MDLNYGLGWSPGIEGFEPIWTVDPSIELVSETAYHHLKLSRDEVAHTTTEFRFQGGFNKLYAVECPRGSFFMRISLPVHPHFKTASEVATIGLLRSHTSIPVPRIIASSSTNDNELKFEWILMERVEGVPLADIWNSLTWDTKVSCVRDVASIVAQLFELRYDSIGNLYNAEDLSIPSKRKTQKDVAESNFVVLGRIVSMYNFWNVHLKADVHLGPFASSRDWFDARFQLMEEDLTRLLESQDPGEDVQDIENAKRDLKRLRNHLPSFFPSTAKNREEFALHHGDISRHNLILDSKGKLQALVDWECVSVVPLWKGCQIPSFLDRRERTQRPDPAIYTSGSDDSNDCYENDLYEFECTCLRGVFLEEMARLAPRWIVEYQTSHSKVDFDWALQGCNGFNMPYLVRRWLKGIESGKQHKRLFDD